MEEKFDFNDILIKQASLSKIISRKNINPFYNGLLPLFTAPMDTVINDDNKEIFKNLKINICMPRGEDCEDGFASYSLDDIFGKYLSNSLQPSGKYLIDVANGNMINLIETTKLIKSRYPNIMLMVGNIANPDAYVALSNAGADYVRCGIGNGGACSTSYHTAIGFPQASLISEIYKASCTLANPAKIVADGGMQTYSDIIKSLGLGADFVMVGSIFNKAIESCGPNYLWNKIRVPQSIAEQAYEFGIPVYKKFRGMSTKEVQLDWGKTKLTTSEGVIRYRRVEYTLAQWVENFEDYLRSAMSYTNAESLDKFIGKVDIIRITNNAYNRFKK